MVSNTTQKLKYYESNKSNKENYYFTIAFDAITCWLFIDHFYFTTHISHLIWENAKCKMQTFKWIIFIDSTWEHEIEKKWNTIAADHGAWLDYY